MSCKTGMEKLRVCLQTIFKNNFITQKRCLTNFWLNNNFLKFVLKKRCFLEEIWDVFNCFLQSVLSNNWKYKKYIGNFCIVCKYTVVFMKNKLRKLFFIFEFPNSPILVFYIVFWAIIENIKNTLETIALYISVQ